MAETLLGGLPQGPLLPNDSFTSTGLSREQAAPTKSSGGFDALSFITDAAGIASRYYGAQQDISFDRAMFEIEFDNAMFQANQLDYNAKIAEWRAQEAQRLGEVEAGQIDAETEQIIGTQRAAYAAQNVVVDQGSPVDIERSTRLVQAMEVDRVRNNAFREAFGMKLEATRDRQLAQFQRSSAQRTRALSEQAARSAQRTATAQASSGIGGLIGGVVGGLFGDSKEDTAAISNAGTVLGGTLGSIFG